MFGFSVCLLANLESADRTFPFPYLLIYLFFLQPRRCLFPVRERRRRKCKKVICPFPSPSFSSTSDISAAKLNFPPLESSGNDSICSPIRYFLYLYPEEPSFSPDEVGEAAFLTPYIRADDLEGARERARVRGLQWPGLESYAGFLTVSPVYDSHLYFWFFPSQSDPSKDPVILWLQV